jgi:hypothetical protein
MQSLLELLAGQRRSHDWVIEMTDWSGELG